MMSTYSDSYKYVNQRPQNKEIFWVICFAIASFSFELPIIYIFPSYRLNPRLFDIAFFILIAVAFLHFSKKKDFTIRKNGLLLPWGICAIGIGFGSLVSLFWIPEASIKYSVFFALKYLLSFIFLVIALGNSLSYEQIIVILRIATLSGIFASIIPILQDFGFIDSFTRFTAEGIFVSERFGMVSGTLESPFQLATQGCLYLVINQALFSTEKSFWGRVVYFFGIILAVIAVFLSGVRTGIFMISLIFVGKILFHSTMKIIYRILLLVLFLLLIFGVFQLIISSELSYDFRTVSRISELIEYTFEGNSFLSGTSFTSLYYSEYYSNNLWQRILTPFRQLGIIISWNAPLAFFFGIGYGMVESLTTNNLQHLHSIFLWPFQYGGIFPVFGFAYLIIMVAKRLDYLRKHCEIPTIRKLAQNMFCYLGAWSIVGLSGQVFWFYEGLGSYPTFLLLLWGILLQFSPPPKSANRAIY